MVHSCLVCDCVCVFSSWKTGVTFRLAVLAKALARLGHWPRHQKGLALLVGTSHLGAAQLGISVVLVRKKPAPQSPPLIELYHIYSISYLLFPHHRPLHDPTWAWGYHLWRGYAERRLTDTETEPSQGQNVEDLHDSPNVNPNDQVEWITSHDYSAWSAALKVGALLLHEVVSGDATWRLHNSFFLGLGITHQFSPELSRTTIDIIDHGHNNYSTYLHIREMPSCQGLCRLKLLQLLLQIAIWSTSGWTRYTHTRQSEFLAPICAWNKMEQDSWKF